jgi:toxin ParE1/3/4
MLEIVKRPRAKQDLKDIWRYNFEQWGATQADKYLAELDAGIGQIRKNPRLGKPRDDLRASYRSLQVNEHMIYYVLNLLRADAFGDPHRQGPACPNGPGPAPLGRRSTGAVLTWCAARTQRFNRGTPRPRWADACRPTGRRAPRGRRRAACDMHRSWRDTVARLYNPRRDGIGWRLTGATTSRETNVQSTAPEPHHTVRSSRGFTRGIHAILC